jgi:hypothetical protein
VLVKAIGREPGRETVFDPNVQLAHLHGGELVPMSRREHHDPADHDLERALARGARIFRCDRCADEVVMVPDETREPRSDSPSGT